MRINIFQITDTDPDAQIRAVKMHQQKKQIKNYVASDEHQNTDPCTLIQLIMNFHRPDVFGWLRQETPKTEDWIEIQHVLQLSRISQ